MLGPRAVPAILAVLGLFGLNFWRPSWSLVTGLAWLCAVVLVPGFVVVIEIWDG